MTTLDHPYRQSRLAIMVSALLLMCTAGGALAANAIPSTTDYRNATQPMITGRVLMASEHDMVVSTEQGNEIPLTLDTHTMVPAYLAEGMLVRVEFHYLNDGSRHAKRVIPILKGQRVTRELAYSRERDDDEAEARYAAAYPASHFAGYAPPTAVTTATHLRMDRPAPVPSTEEYKLATQPIIIGRVISATDHRLVVDTDRGQRVALEMDSRTLVPSDLQSGIGVKVEYRSVDNGARLATRVVPIRYDRDHDVMQEEFIHPAADDRDAMIDAQTAEYVGEGGDDAYVAQATDTDVNGTAGTDADDVDHGTLPKTSSEEPLLVLLGLLALGTGAAVMLRRTSHVG